MNKEEQSELHFSDSFFRQKKMENSNCQIHRIQVRYPTVLFFADLIVG